MKQKQSNQLKHENLTIRSIRYDHGKINLILRNTHQASGRPSNTHTWPSSFLVANPCANTTFWMNCDVSDDYPMHYRCPQSFPGSRGLHVPPLSNVLLFSILTLTFYEKLCDFHVTFQTSIFFKKSYIVLFCSFKSLI